MTVNPTVRLLARKIHLSVAAYSLPRTRYCIGCSNHVGRFLPYRRGSRGRPALMRALDMVGSDVDNFCCPRCGAHDRERHLLLYLRASALQTKFESSTVLHFAPEPVLARRIAETKPSQYVKCDLHPQSRDLVKVDMLDIPFGAETFDFLIANHVLEHVDDDLRALREIRRVLKIGGHAILQTPYSAKLMRTWQDPGIADERARLEAFGQEDHVRLYGSDIFERFCSTGLLSKVRNHTELLADVDVEKYGVNAREPFFLFQRAD
jgi:SAM-dependent methyltransferase